MADAAEVAIEGALIARLQAMVVSPAVPVAYPNVEFSPPDEGPHVYWLRATFLPADSFALGVDHGSTNQHYGIFQVDVFYGQKSGEYAPGRVATQIIQWFKRGTVLTKDGFTVKIGVGSSIPKRERMLKDDPWVIIPVSIPYLAFASNPA